MVDMKRCGGLRVKKIAGTVFLLSVLFATSLSFPEDALAAGRVIHLLGHVRLIGGVRLGGMSPIARVTCGTGSNIAFTYIGGGQCRGYIVAITGTTTWTVPANWNNANNTIEAIGGGGGGGKQCCI